MARSVERALAEERVLSLTFRDRNGVVTDRRVDPVLLANANGRWRLVAWCRRRDGIRWFRLDRIVAAEVTSERANDVPVESVGPPPASARSVAVLDR